MWKVAALIFLIGSAGATPGAPAPSIASLVAATKSIAAAAPAVARAFGASVVGQSAVCHIPANDAPLDKGNPMASNIQPYEQPANHVAHVDSADDLWDSLGGLAAGFTAGVAAALVGGGAQQAAGDVADVAGEFGGEIEMGGQVIAQGVEGIPDGEILHDAQEAAEGVEHLGAQVEGGAVDGIEQAGAAVAQGAEAAQVAEAGAGEAAGAAVGGGEVGAGVAVGIEGALEVATVAAQTAQADSVDLDLQDGDVATSDASLKAVQDKGVANPVKLAVLAGKPKSNAAAAQAPLTAFQNILVLAPQQATQARTPSGLPSAIQAGAATPVKPTPSAGGRKMLQSSDYPDCCNTYTVKPGDTLDSVAAAFGQPDNGAKIIQAVNGLPSASVAPGDTIMLPCGRVLSYINAYNVGLLTKATAAG